MEDLNSIIVVADNRRRLKFVHSCKKFGGTCIISTVSIGGLIGSGPRASPIVIDMDVATTATEVKIPPTERIWHCNNTKELNKLPINGGAEPQQTPSLRRLTRTGHPAVSANETESTNTNTATETGEADEMTQTYTESAVKIPVPFLAIAALECGSPDPLDIIIAIKTATNDFNDSHKNATDFDYEYMQSSGEDFANWLYAVHMNLIAET